MTLSDERCVPCPVGEKPLSKADAGALARDVPRWTLAEKRIERKFKFKDFCQAMSFVNRVADAADEQDHHPNMNISYDQVRLTLSTDKIGGLSRNDFILAAKIDLLIEDPVHV